MEDRLMENNRSWHGPAALLLAGLALLVALSGRFNFQFELSDQPQNLFMTSQGAMAPDPALAPSGVDPSQFKEQFREEMNRFRDQFRREFDASGPAPAPTVVPPDVQPGPRFGFDGPSAIQPIMPPMKSMQRGWNGGDGHPFFGQFGQFLMGPFGWFGGGPWRLLGLALLLWLAYRVLRGRGPGRRRDTVRLGGGGDVPPPTAQA
jgi:hypothetical protein